MAESGSRCFEEETRDHSLSRRPRRGLALTIFAATASLLLAACGSSDTKAGTTTADGITLVSPVS